LRSAQGDNTRLGALADELVARRPDLLFGIESVATVLRARTKSIPIVVPTASDLVAAGLVESLAKPGTNVTGIQTFGDQLVAKQVELLIEIVPALARVAFLNDPTAPAARRIEQVARDAAKARGLALVAAGASEPDDVRRAFAAFERDGSQGLVVAATGRMNQLRGEIIAEVRRLRLPAVSGLPAPTWAEAGALVTYSANFLESFRYAASFVDRILKGAKPADLPVEQPTKFELVLNLKAAREIGLAIPSAVLLRTDRVIE